MSASNADHNGADTLNSVAILSTLITLSEGVKKREDLPKTLISAGFDDLAKKLDRYSSTEDEVVTLALGRLVRQLGWTYFEQSVPREETRTVEAALEKAAPAVLHKNLQRCVDDNIQRSPFAKLLKWLSVVAIVVILGGSIGAEIQIQSQVDSVNKTADSTRDRIEKYGTDEMDSVKTEMNGRLVALNTSLNSLQEGAASSFQAGVSDGKNSIAAAARADEDSLADAAHTAREHANKRADREFETAEHEVLNHAQVLEGELDAAYGKAAVTIPNRVAELSSEVNSLENQVKSLKTQIKTLEPTRPSGAPKRPAPHRAGKVRSGK